MAENATQQKIVIDERIGRIFKQQVQNAGVRDAARAYRAIVSLIAGDGDFTDIQSAINYVNTLGGGSILIRIGEHVISDDITMYDNIHLVGEDRDNSIINFNTTTKHILINTLSNIRIENLTIKNCWSTTGAIYIYESINVNILGVRFTENTTASNTGYDIYTDARQITTTQINQQILVSGCYSSGAAHFIKLNACQNNSRIHGNYIVSPTSIVFQGSTNTGRGLDLSDNVVTGYNSSVIDGTGGNEFFEAKITKNTFISPAVGQTGYCIIVVGSLVISDNYISGLAGGIKMSSGIDSRISNNEIGASNGEALWMNSMLNVNIVGNKIAQSSTSTYYALKIAGTCFNIHVIGNTITTISNTNIPVVILSAAGSCQICGNTINAGSVGVLIDVGSNNNQVSGNSISSSTSSGTAIKIDGDSDYNQIIGNTAIGGGGGTSYGIDVANANCNGNIVIGNRCTGNTAATHDVGTASVFANNN